MEFEFGTYTHMKNGFARKCMPALQDSFTGTALSERTRGKLRARECSFFVFYLARGPTGGVGPKGRPPPLEGAGARGTGPRGAGWRNTKEP